MVSPVHRYIKYPRFALLILCTDKGGRRGFGVRPRVGARGRAAAPLRPPLPRLVPLERKKPRGDRPRGFDRQVRMSLRNLPKDRLGSLHGLIGADTHRGGISKGGGNRQAHDAVLTDLIGRRGRYKQSISICATGIELGGA